MEIKRNGTQPSGKGSAEWFTGNVRIDPLHQAPAPARAAPVRRELMTAWTGDELDKIGRAEELQIASLRNNGTARKPVTIWVVRVGDDLYVRSVYGRGSGWFRGTHTCPGGWCQGVRHEGHIHAGGVDKDVTFAEETDSDINEQIDTAYRTKYRRYASSIVNSTMSVEARAATIKLVPRDSK